MTNWTLLNPDLIPTEGWEVLNEKIGGAHSWLIEYYKNCRRGDRLIGADLKTQLEMLIQDLNNPEFRFELTKPHKRIKFIETQIKHFESPFAGVPFIMTLEQKAITEAIFGFEYYDPEYQEWLRRFTEVFLFMARKNGKTPFVAALTQKIGDRQGIVCPNGMNKQGWCSITKQFQGRS